MKTKKIIQNLIRRYPALETCQADIVAASAVLIKTYRNGGKVLTCGNGGSAADADHIVGELMKSFEKKRVLNAGTREALVSMDPERGSYLAEKLQEGLPAISLNAHVALISAVANDMDADLIFAQQVAGYGKNGDVLIAITTSGNSRNVIDAAITARAKGLVVIGLTGESGGQLKKFSDIAIRVPAHRTAEVQEYHLPVYHTLCRVVEEELFGRMNSSYASGYGGQG